MSEQKSKSIADSVSVQVHLVMNMDINDNGTLFGGRLMSWIDEVAGVVARRHSGTMACTASVDRLDFLSPAYLGDVVSVEGRVINVGRTSMIVEVKTFVQNLSTGEDGKKLVNLAYLTMVAMDANGKPTPVPRIVPHDDEEKTIFEYGIEIRERIKKALSE